MVGGGRKRGGALATALSIADAASWTCALALVVLILVSSLREPGGARRGGRRRRRRRRRRWLCAGEAGEPGVRGDIRGGGGGDAAHHQRQVRRPVHRRAQPPHPRPRRCLPRARHHAHPDQQAQIKTSERVRSILCTSRIIV
uniref:Uncharacterized protein n=1 Tax=Ananas comosus var. bracteatus TaxID=296719 RepID=A0A6V7QN29_ANACO|nr:unnamed protein product [Ananas comosus var. bracteatus]